MTGGQEPAGGRTDERAVLVTLIAQARAELARLETALGRLDSGQDPDHPVVFWRKRRNMTQSELARVVGVTPAAICRIEHSPGFMGRMETRVAIAAALDVPMDWLQPPSD